MVPVAKRPFDGTSRPFGAAAQPVGRGVQAFGAGEQAVAERYIHGGGTAQDEGTQMIASPIVEGELAKGRGGRERTTAAPGGPYGFRLAAVSPGETSAGTALALAFMTV